VTKSFKLCGNDFCGDRSRADLGRISSLVFLVFCELNFRSDVTIQLRSRAFDQSNIQPNLKSCQIAWFEGRSVQNANETVLQINEWVPNADCKLGAKRRLQSGHKMQTADCRMS